MALSRQLISNLSQIAVTVIAPLAQKKVDCVKVSVVKILLRRICLATGAIWLAWQALLLAGTWVKQRLEDRKPIVTTLSPDGKYAATVMRTIGSSGATSTWCDIAIYVTAVEAAHPPSPGQGDLVYSGGCDFAIESPPGNVRWTAPTSLEVAFDPEIAGTAELGNRALNGAIRVTYSLRKGQYPF